VSCCELEKGHGGGVFTNPVPPLEQEFSCWSLLVFAGAIPHDQPVLPWNLPMNRAAGYGPRGGQVADLTFSLGGLSPLGEPVGEPATHRNLVRQMGPEVPSHV